MCWNRDCLETTLNLGIDLDNLRVCFFAAHFQYPSEKETKPVDVFVTKADLVLLRLGISLAGWEAGSSSSHTSRMERDNSASNHQKTCTRISHQL